MAGIPVVVPTTLFLVGSIIVMTFARYGERTAPGLTSAASA
jgi:uncharacterized protein (DUF486 family)